MLFPYSDENPSNSQPFVLQTIVAINVAVFLFQLYLSAFGLLPQFFQTYAVIPAREFSNFNQVISGQIGLIPTLLFPIFAAMFMHGGFFHIIGNMLFLWIFGDNIEDVMGHVKFLMFYLLCGIGATAAQIVSDPASIIPNIGASGAIAGVLGAYLINFPKARVKAIFLLGFIPIKLRIPALFYLGWWFVQQAFYSVLSLDDQVNMGTGGVAYWAHAGGFVFGVLLVKFFMTKQNPKALF
ncbi:MAG: rhomboid family intramembrane serine protease [Cyanobacteria bacterium J06597_1]